jgi:hypothetical protein
MTAKVLTIYDQIVTQLGTSLPNHQRLPNPYQVDENAIGQLTNGYGLVIGPGVDTKRYVGCIVTWERTFTIILVRKITTTSNNIGSRVIIEKDIIEDHDTLRKDFYLNSTLGQNAIQTTVLSDGGIQFVTQELSKFLAMEIQLVTEYQEDPNA